jgi:2-octaprenyl-6-methoxyphenol hydroxylase
MSRSAGSPPDSAAVAVDGLIVGGGLVGGVLACALGEAGFDVAVVDVADPRRVLDRGFDGRASAIALSSRRLLEGIGLWPAIRDEAAPMLQIRVSDGSSPLFLHYDHRDIGHEPFGHMVENRVLRQAIADRLQALPTVRVFAPSRIAAVERRPAGVEATLADGTAVSARLLVAAEGRASPTRDAAGIRLTRWDYPQVGIVCTVAHDRPHRFIAHEHFLTAGPFAILPLLGGRSSIVWTERKDLAPAIMALDDDAFTAELSSRFGDFLGPLRVVGPRWSYPLSLQYAETATGPRLALVGDALHAMHPIAGQGLNMGLRDVAALAEVMVDAARVGADIGDRAVLDRYQRWRRFDNLLMLVLTDGLNRLFSNDLAPVRLARDVGLAAVDAMPTVKRLFMRHAMGVVGELPRLMRGQAL